MTDVEIDAVGRPEKWAEVFDVEIVAALRLTDAMCAASHSIDPELVVELRAHYTEEELAELILVSGQANLNNRVGNAAKQVLGGTPSPE